MQDVTFTNNIVRHVAGVVNIAGFDDSDPTLRTERITFRNNLFDDVNHTAYGTNAKALLVGDGAATLVFDRNTIIHTNSSVLYAYGAAMPGVVYTNNVSQHHRYGIMGDGASTGKPTIAKYFPGGVVRCNVLAGGPASLYPHAERLSDASREWNASFVDPAAGDYRLIPGSRARRSPACPGTTAGRGLRGADCRDGRHQPPRRSRPADPANQPPVADAGGPYTAAVGASVSADGTAIAAIPTASVLDYLWHWGDEVLVRAADLPRVGDPRQRVGPDRRRAMPPAARCSSILTRERPSAPPRWPRRRATSSSRSTSRPAFRITCGCAAGLRTTPYANDSLYAAVQRRRRCRRAPLARIGTTNGAVADPRGQAQDAGVAGWGWSDSDYGGAAAPIYFAQSRSADHPHPAARGRRRLGSADSEQRGIHRRCRARPRTITTHRRRELSGTSTGVSAVHRYQRAGTYPMVLTVTDAEARRRRVRTSSRRVALTVRRDRRTRSGWRRPGVRPVTGMYRLTWSIGDVPLHTARGMHESRRWNPDSVDPHTTASCCYKMI